MYFEPQLWEKGKRVCISDKAIIEGAFGFGLETLEKTVKEYGTAEGTITKITAINKVPEGTTINIGDEGYVIIINESEAILYYVSERSHVYGAVTFEQMCVSGELCECRLEDAPDCAFRGYRGMLPGRADFENFKAFVDSLAYFKYNYIFLEVGGAMEYKRHPEINETWQKFAAYCREKTGRTREINFSGSHPKNAIHCDNGDGDILTQNEVREIIAYCRSRGLEVFPEVPLLAHTDYICHAHPEIAERNDDPYPNAYCPNHPNTYPIVFDILEEVIEVFKPKFVHIGHDELYDIGLCDRCKDKKPYEIFAEHIIKIHDFLAKKSVGTMMWGDRLQPVVLKNGRAIGGSGMDYLSDVNGKRRYSPPLFWAQGMLPKDIIMVNWFHGYGIQYDYVFHTHKYPAIFGNMNCSGIEHWRERKELGTNGGFLSNWGSYAYEYMQRNLQIFNIIFNSYVLWSTKYDNDMKDYVYVKTTEEALNYHFGKMGNGKFIGVVHSTAKRFNYRSFLDGNFIDNEKYHMGKYVLTYDDGSTAEFDVKYGYNILCDKTPVNNVDKNIAEELVDAESFVPSEVCSTAIALRMFGKTCFKTFFENPHPEKKIAKFIYVSECDTPVDLISYERI